MARNGKSKDQIKDYIETSFGYHLGFALDEIRPHYQFDVSSQGSVPQAIRAFLESADYESTIRLAISIGGDSDTIACIAGGIAQAYYNKINNSLVSLAKAKLTDEMIFVLDKYEKKFGVKQNLITNRLNGFGFFLKPCP